MPRSGPGAESDNRRRFSGPEFVARVNVRCAVCCTDLAIHFQGSDDVPRLPSHAHFAELAGIYEERFEHRYGQWRPAVRGVVEKFLDC